MEINDPTVQRCAVALEEHFRWGGHPGTRMPGTEAVSCDEAALVVLTVALAQPESPEEDPEAPSP